MAKEIIMVLVRSDNIEDASEAAYEAEEAMKLESGSGCFSPINSTLFMNNIEIQIISSEEVGIPAFKKRLEQLETERQRIIKEVASEFGANRLDLMFQADEHDIWRVSEGLRLARGGIGYDCPCWDATNQTSNLKIAIESLSEEESYWLVPVEID